MSDPEDDPAIEAEWKRMQAWGQRRSYANGWRIVLVLLVGGVTTALMLLAVFALAGALDPGLKSMKLIVVCVALALVLGLRVAAFTAKRVGLTGYKMPR